ncbi:MAG: hypothetical protein AAGD11_18645 [Planctomycetota bacterium]
MINALAHITPTEAPAGTLLFLAGFAAGFFAWKLVAHFRMR